MGRSTFKAELPCDPSSLTRWRDRLGEAGVEELLVQTIEAAKAMKAISVHELRRVVVDSTVQKKAVAYPADSRLLEVAREKLVEVARAQVIALRQSYRRTGPRLSRQAGSYAHAKPYKRMRRVLRKQRTIVGRLLRDIERKADENQFKAMAELLARVSRLHSSGKRSRANIATTHPSFRARLFPNTMILVAHHTKSYATLPCK